ncbi:hypothetical protein D8B24_13815 [Verminephrobacter aporrectodeae subsp. tuberculatae]|nr:hypothetical protein [Verminephrobacter aporrectodeae subsp. tuberculatae]
MVFLVACNNTDSDGVPRVEDPNNPVDAKGNPISTGDFIKKYCRGMVKINNETCDNVSQANHAKSLKGGLPKGW